MIHTIGIIIGGIRLAGLLNEIFRNGLTSSSVQSPVIRGKVDKQQFPVKTIDEVAQNIGKPVTIIDVVSDYKIVNSTLTLLNIGGKYPNQKLTIALKGSVFKLKPAELKNKKIWVSGTIELYKDRPEILVTTSDNISLYKP